MPAALLDTTVLFAAANACDAYHDDALPVLQGVDAGDLPDAVVVDFVLAETLNGLTRDVSAGAAVDFLERLEENSRFSIERVTADGFATGKALFRRHDRLSFVDALLVGHLHDRDLEYVYSFDADFDGLDGVTRLATPDNPFSA